MAYDLFFNLFCDSLEVMLHACEQLEVVKQ